MFQLEEQILMQVEKAKNILLVFSSDWEADELGSALAFYLFLKKKQKSVTISASENKEISPTYQFLPGADKIKNNLLHLRRFIVSLDISKTKVSQIKYVIEKDQLNFIISPEDSWFKASDVSSRASGFLYDLIISFGANDLESLGDIYDHNVEFFYNTPIINISNRSSNENFGQINLVNINSSSISEMVYNLINEGADSNSFDADIATNLLAGIILSTENFKIGKISPQTLLITSQLINYGGRREEIIKKLHYTHQIGDLKVWGQLLQNLKIEKNKLAWAEINRSNLPNHQLQLQPLKKLINDLISSLNDVNLVLLVVKDKEENEIFLLSLKNENVIPYLEKYSPQLKAGFATALSTDSIPEIIDYINNQAEALIN